MTVDQAVAYSLVGEDQTTTADPGRRRKPGARRLLHAERASATASGGGAGSAANRLGLAATPSVGPPGLRRQRLGSFPTRVAVRLKPPAGLRSPR